MDWDEVKKAADAILKRGNDVEIRRKGVGWLFLFINTVRQDVKQGDFYGRRTQRAGHGNHCS